jgi:hypothetical protein
VRKDDKHETMMKGNDGDRWSSDDVMLWVVKSQNRDVVEC